tara:strand:+ start:138 stop:491 length:354 start_codon:yes stop_codon:yes gene_type:complete
MERSRAGKSGFKMKSSALRAGETIMGRFMAMGKTLGNSKTKTSTTIDPSKYYTPPKKTVEKEKESAVNQNKREKAEKEIKERKDAVEDGTNFKLNKGTTLNTNKGGELGTDINQEFE